MAHRHMVQTGYWDCILGDCVLSLCAISGSLLVAAKHTGRSCIAIDIDGVLVSCLALNCFRPIVSSACSKPIRRSAMRSRKRGMAILMGAHYLLIYFF